MNRTLTLTAGLATLLTLSACSSSNSPSSDTASAHPSIAISTTSVATSGTGQSSPSAEASATLPASAIMTKLTAAIPQAKLTAVYTEDNDPNHLLGRPNQYVSKVEFKDARIHTADVTGVPPGSIQYGGSIEVFTSSADAAQRAATIQQGSSNQPAVMEYDYVHGDVLIRVSHYVTPTQAKAYEAFANTLP
ncbi:hypothetical protein [Streptacidiphilus melanogenes]|uniref:hypothetical protein n=1 Tax=Streptacidiphilus melanogenes TaxID=411235 RepID=UPI0005A934A2|nr:hypothetical protein [Streptacidiphilus melanogenes]